MKLQTMLCDDWLFYLINVSFLVLFMLKGHIFAQRAKLALQACSLANHRFFTHIRWYISNTLAVPGCNIHLKAFKTNFIFSNKMKHCGASFLPLVPLLFSRCYGSTWGCFRSWSLPSSLTLIISLLFILSHITFFVGRFLYSWLSCDN